MSYSDFQSCRNACTKFGANRYNFLLKEIRQGVWLALKCCIPSKPIRNIKFSQGIYLPFDITSGFGVTMMGYHSSAKSHARIALQIPPVDLDDACRVHRRRPDRGPATD